MPSNFVISLDFELMWGVLDKKSIHDYGSHIQAVHRIVPKLLKLFDQYNIKATFSTVGMLFHKDLDSLISTKPAVLPEYTDRNLSPYNYFDTVDGAEYYLAAELIQLIQAYKNQEIGTHTYCHYYCLEPGQTIEAFKSDLNLALQMAEGYGVKLDTLIFPRNQYNEDYLNICKEAGLIGYRGNEDSWLYEAGKGSTQHHFKRAFRLLDAYLNISGHHAYNIQKSKGLTNVKASRFLRPYSRKLKAFEGLRLNRIKKSMIAAAKQGKTYHLWWHPHNFGSNMKENFDFLEKILAYYQFLHQSYGMQSHSMKSLILASHEK